MSSSSGTQAQETTDSSTKSNKNTGLSRIYFDGDSGLHGAITELPDSFEDLQDVVEKFFQIPIGTPLIINVSLLGSGNRLKTDSSAWHELRPNMEVVWISLDSNDSVSRTSRREAQDHFPIFVKSMTGKTMTLEVKPSNTVPEVRTMVMDWSGEPSIQQRLIFNGGRLESDQTLAEVGIKAGSTIFLVLSLRKPVIYLFSPTTLNAVIDLSLLPGLKFSALYPVVPIKEQGETSNGCKVVSQCVSWKVQVLPDGTLLDKDSGSLVSYLYWEATTNPTIYANITPPNSRSASPITETSDLARLEVDPSNSVLVSTQKVPKYLDSALLALGVHTEARTSFITYWLPDLLKYAHVAFRFLPQEEYEKVAPLNVKPEPVIVVRIFMLWKGVSDEIINHWKESSSRAEGMDVAEWRGGVGVPDGFDVERQRCQGDGLTVLEWGGMEVIG